MVTNGQLYQSMGGGGPTGRPGDLKHQPVTEILQRVAEDSKALATEELQLARTEITAKLKTAGKGAGLFGAAGAIAFFAVGALTAAFILALALVMP
ncbi:MAG TPA: phage holin family protein, partial [Candidatus Dormibacteraeota bacterium]|nr:phage holin family protein [Candidatus Dormibacteraeota bacterium]